MTVKELREALDVIASWEFNTWIAIATTAARERLEQLEREDAMSQAYDAERSAKFLREKGALVVTLLHRLKSVIGETFIDKMGWGESNPMAALEAYALAEYQAQAVIDALHNAQPQGGE